MPPTVLVRAPGEGVVVRGVDEDALGAKRSVKIGLVLPLPLHAVTGIVVVVVVAAAGGAAVGPVRLDHRETRGFEKCIYLREQPAVPSGRKALRPPREGVRMMI